MITKAELIIDNHTDFYVLWIYRKSGYSRHKTRMKSSSGKRLTRYFTNCPDFWTKDWSLLPHSRSTILTIKRDPNDHFFA